MASVEKEHDFSFSELEKMMSEIDFMKLLTEAVTFSAETQSAVLNLLVTISNVGPQLQNSLILKPSEKLVLADKLDAVVNQTERAIGLGKVVTKPTDLDRELIEKCANKNYHDTITNAFPILEDRLRAKLKVGKEYFSDKLIDYAFNTNNGRLILGDTESEKQGVLLLFKGAFLFLRNPPTHSHMGSEDRNAALKILHTVDLLLKMIEKAKYRT